MANRQHSSTHARRLERVIRRAIGTGNNATLRAVATLAHDHHLGAVQARAEAALRFIGDRQPPLEIER
ncbi:MULTISPECIES: hypothetical protein [unclassified Thiocapsa]|uniref:hypothetical protein n=1 Tax=unclassified Thiocapsa TaxID=2641286 RepID=UPI0035B4DF3C